jgi:hypothetical protein
LAQALRVALGAVFVSGGAEVVVVEGGAGVERLFAGGVVVLVAGEVFVGEVDHEQGVDDPDAVGEVLWALVNVGEASDAGAVAGLWGVILFLSALVLPAGPPRRYSGPPRRGHHRPATSRNRRAGPRTGGRPPDRSIPPCCRRQNRGLIRLLASLDYDLGPPTSVERLSLFLSLGGR